MKRVVGSVVIGGVFAVIVASAIAPLGQVSAAPGDAGVDAGAAAPSTSGGLSPYLVKAASGIVYPPSVEDAEAFCALVLACRDVPMFPPAPDFTGCVQALMDQLSSPGALNASLAIRECGLSATSCKTLRACALKGAKETICEGVATDTKEPVGKCDLDARAVTCWRGKVFGVRNCGLADELCVVKDGKAECAFPGACPPGVGADWKCAGPRMVRCLDSKYLSLDCRVLNLTCTTGTDGSGKASVGCAPPTSGTCKSTDKITCNGANAATCILGREVKVACGDVGMTCADPTKPGTDRTVGACELPVSDKPCDPKKFEAKCDGSQIKYCAHGAIRSFSCKSIGANKCVSDKGTGPRCTA